MNGRNDRPKRPERPKRPNISNNQDFNKNQNQQVKSEVYYVPDEKKVKILPIILISFLVLAVIVTVVILFISKSKPAVDEEIPPFSGTLTNEQIESMAQAEGDAQWQIFIDSIRDVPSDIKGMTKLDKLNMGLSTDDGSDTDGDGLTDKEEIEVYGTDPLKASTAGDNISDGYKIQNGMDPFTYYDDDSSYVSDVFTKYNGFTFFDTTIENKDVDVTEFIPTSFYGMTPIVGFHIMNYEGAFEIDFSKYAEGYSNCAAYLRLNSRPNGDISDFQQLSLENNTLYYILDNRNKLYEFYFVSDTTVDDSLGIEEESSTIHYNSGTPNTLNYSLTTYSVPNKNITLLSSRRDDIRIRLLNVNDQTSQATTSVPSKITDNKGNITEDCGCVGAEVPAADVVIDDNIGGYEPGPTSTPSYTPSPTPTPRPTTTPTPTPKQTTTPTLTTPSDTNTYTANSGFEIEKHGFRFPNFSSYLKAGGYCAGFAYVTMLNYNYNPKNNTKLAASMQSTFDIAIPYVPMQTFRTIDRYSTNGDGDKILKDGKPETSSITISYEADSFYDYLFGDSLYKFSLVKPYNTNDYDQSKAERDMWDVITDSAKSVDATKPIVTPSGLDDVVIGFVQFITYYWDVANENLKGVFESSTSTSDKGIESLKDYIVNGNIAYASMHYKYTDNSTGAEVNSGHAVNVRAILSDSNDPFKYYLYVYDNNMPANNYTNTAYDNCITVILSDKDGKGLIKSYEYDPYDSKFGQTDYTSDRKDGGTYWFRVYDANGSYYLSGTNAPK